MNPWAILGWVAAALLALSAVGYWQNQAGQDKCNAKWEKREASELRLANQKILDLTQAAREKERQHAESISNIDTNYQRKLENEKHKTDALVADLLAGSLVLRDPSQSPGPSGTGQTNPGSSLSNGQAGCQLSTETAQFLISEAGRADDITLQLGACQQIIIQDRE